MLSCILRIDGGKFDVERYLGSAQLVPDNVYRRGEKRRVGPAHQTSGFSVLVSESADGDFASAAADAVSFLRRHRGDLVRLAALPGVDGMTLDFGRGFPVGEVFAQNTRLPVDLLRECAEIGIEIELSIYAVE